MRKLSFLLVLAIILSMITLPVAHAEETFISYEDYDGKIWGGWDSVRFDDVIQGTDGQAGAYVRDRDGIITGKANKVQVRGWLGFEEPIESYGYIIDDKEIVLNEAFFADTEQGVYDVAASMNLEFAYRFYIEIDVSTWTERHNIKYCCKFKDGPVVTLVNNEFYPIEFDFIRMSEDATPTPEPTKVPVYEGDDVPGVWFMFNNDEIVENCAGYIGQSNRILSEDYNDELKCLELYVEGQPDPNVYIPVTLISDEDISADDYKAILFIYQFNPEDAFNGRTDPIGGSIYWQTEDAIGFSEDKRTAYDVYMTKDVQVSIVNLEKPKKWTGSIQDFRYDFLDTCEGDFTFDLFAIAFFKTNAGAEAFREKYLQLGNEAFPATPVPTEAPTKAPTEAPTATEVPTQAAATNAPKATDAAKDADEGGSNAGIIIGIISAVVVIAAIVIYIVVKKKK